MEWEGTGPDVTVQVSQFMCRLPNTDTFSCKFRRKTDFSLGISNRIASNYFCMVDFRIVESSEN